MLTSAKHIVTYLYSMTTDAIYQERGPDWSRQVSVVATTRWLQRDQTLPLSCEGCGLRDKVRAWSGEWNEGTPKVVSEPDPRKIEKGVTGKRGVVEVYTAEF